MAVENPLIETPPQHQQIRLEDDELQLALGTLLGMPLEEQAPEATQAKDKDAKSEALPWKVSSGQCVSWIDLWCLQSHSLPLLQLAWNAMDLLYSLWRETREEDWLHIGEMALAAKATAAEIFAFIYYLANRNLKIGTKEGNKIKTERST